MPHTAWSSSYEINISTAHLCAELFSRKHTFHWSYSAEPAVSVASLAHFAQSPWDDLFSKERAHPSPVTGSSQKSIGCWRLLWVNETKLLDIGGKSICSYTCTTVLPYGILDTPEIILLWKIQRSKTRSIEVFVLRNTFHLGRCSCSRFNVP